MFLTLFYIELFKILSAKEIINDETSFIDLVLADESGYVEGVSSPGNLITKMNLLIINSL